MNDPESTNTNLILSRKKGEVVYLDGGRISVTVITLTESRVRLLFNAPPNMDIFRGELLAAASEPEAKEGAA